MTRGADAGALVRRDDVLTVVARVLNFLRIHAPLMCRTPLACFSVVAGFHSHGTIETVVVVRATVGALFSRLAQDVVGRTIGTDALLLADPRGAAPLTFSMGNAEVRIGSVGAAVRNTLPVLA